MKYVVIGGIVILAVFLAALSQIPLGIEPLTELYFEEHTELPRHVFLDKEYNFSFSVVNLEYRGMDYEYSVVAEVGEETRELDSGVISLWHEENGTIEESFSFDEGFEKAKIVVNIEKVPIGEEPWFKKKLWWPDPNYAEEIDIHFWVEEIVGTTIIITPD